MKVIVTGGTGSWDRGVGPVVIAALEAKGHEVTNLDRAVPGASRSAASSAPISPITARPLRRCTATTRSSSWPPMASRTGTTSRGAARFHTNSLIAYNVFQAACFLGMRKVVWASSETVLGFPFDKVPPKVLPTNDDDPPIPTSSYGISKANTEDLARHMNRRYGVPFVGLRFSNIFYDTPGHVTSYERVPAFWDDPLARRFNLWGYVDSRDTADACVQALESIITGAEVMTIAAPDTLMRQTNAELVAAAFPGCTSSRAPARTTRSSSIDKARKLIGYNPQWTWRRVLGRDG